MDNNKVIPGAISYLMIKYLCKKYKKALTLRKNKFKNLKTVKKELSHYYSFHLFILNKNTKMKNNIVKNNIFSPSIFKVWYLFKF